MQIRTKLTLLFVTLVAVIFLLASLSVYYFSAEHREEDFYGRLLNKGTSTAKLLIEVEEVDAQLLAKIEKNNPITLPNEAILIFDYQNNIIYNYGNQQTTFASKELLNKIRLEGELRLNKDGSEVLGFLFADQFDRFVVIVSATDVYGLRKLSNLRMVLLIVFGVSILLLSVVGWLYAGRVLQPILKVVNQVENISISNLSVRVDEGNGKDEIAHLAQTFNRMLQSLEAAFKIQKNFIANASHELRTPLTAITGQLEVTLLNERNNDEYKQVLNSLLEDIRNLNRTSNRLLLLAQASSESSEVSFAPIRIDDVLWQARTDVLKRNPNYKIDISFSESIEDEKQLLINGNEQLAKTALLNLIDNACKYSLKHEVFVLVEPLEHMIEISFKDQGIGIDAEEIQHIFEPFHRGKNAITFKGHGIGLSLVDRIVKLHHGEINVISAPNAGSTFILRLPHL
jgi:signal transduction histidine kinase